MNPVPGDYKQHVHDTDETVHHHGRVGDHAISDCAPDFCGLDATLAAKTEPIPLWPAGLYPQPPGKIVFEPPALHPCQPGVVADSSGLRVATDAAPGARWQCGGCGEIWYRHGSGEWRRTLKAYSTIDLGFEDQPEQPMHPVMGWILGFVLALMVVTVGMLIELVTR